MVVIHLTMDLGRLEWRFERDSISGGGGAQILECQGNHYNASRFSLLLWPSWHTNGTWKLQPAMYGDSGHKMDSKGMFRGYLERDGVGGRSTPPTYYGRIRSSSPFTSWSQSLLYSSLTSGLL